MWIFKFRLKGVLKLMLKGRSILKKIVFFVVKGKVLVIEIKREEVNELVEDEYEEEFFLFFE